MTARPETLRAVRRWIAKAEEDLAAAERLLSLDDSLAAVVCFHAQQAVEKAAQGAPRHRRRAVRANPRRHPARPDVAPRTGLAGPSADLAPLNRYAVEARYPINEEPLTGDEARDAIALAAEGARGGAQGGRPYRLGLSLLVHEAEQWASCCRLAILGVAPSAAVQPHAAEAARAASPSGWRWRRIAPCRRGVARSALASEAVGLLGSPDSVWRDDIGYGARGPACVHQKKALTAQERRELIARVSANLRRGIGETGTDSVLLRSFSALDLSVFAALESQDPALDDAGYCRLLDDALADLRDERDLRGLESRVGWIHATAHTADLLKFLARDSRFRPADQARLTDAAWARMAAPGTPVFTHAEDERLAAALLSVVRRPDFDPAILLPWLERFVALEKKSLQKAPPDPATLDASQNARNLLRSFFLLLSLPEPAPTTGQAAAREKVLATLQQIRR